MTIAGMGTTSNYPSDYLRAEMLLRSNLAHFFILQILQQRVVVDEADPIDNRCTVGIMRFDFAL